MRVPGDLMKGKWGSSQVLGETWGSQRLLGVPRWEMGVPGEETGVTGDPVGENGSLQVLVEMWRSQEGK